MIYNADGRTDLHELNTASWPLLAPTNCSQNLYKPLLKSNVIHFRLLHCMWQKKPVSVFWRPAVRWWPLTSSLWRHPQVKIRFWCRDAEPLGRPTVTLAPLEPPALTSSPSSGPRAGNSNALAVAEPPVDTRNNSILCFDRKKAENNIFDVNSHLLSFYYSGTRA